MIMSRKCVVLNDDVIKSAFGERSHHVIGVDAET